MNTEELKMEYKTIPCEEDDAWLCYANDNEAARRMNAGFGFEEVPEAYDEDECEMPAVLKL